MGEFPDCLFIFDRNAMEVGLAFCLVCFCCSNNLGLFECVWPVVFVVFVDDLSRRGMPRNWYKWIACCSQMCFFV